MNSKKTVATLVAAGVLVTGLGTGIAVAESGGTGNAAGQPSAAKSFDCSKLSQLTDIEGRLKRNDRDRIAILEDLEGLVGARAANRVQRQIDRLDRQQDTMDARLDRLATRCATPSSSPSA